MGSTPAAEFSDIGVVTRRDEVVVDDVEDDRDDGNEGDDGDDGDEDVKAKT